MRIGGGLRYSTVRVSFAKSKVHVNIWPDTGGRAGNIARFGTGANRVCPPAPPPLCVLTRWKEITMRGFLDASRQAPMPSGRSSEGNEKLVRNIAVAVSIVEGASLYALLQPTVCTCAPTQDLRHREERTAIAPRVLHLSHVKYILPCVENTRHWWIVSYQLPCNMSAQRNEHSIKPQPQQATSTL